MSSLGEKLRQAREARGVSISEIAEQTRISSHYLEAIESDDYRTLPGGIFNKGFVKSYAKYVGVDEQEALQDYAKIISEQTANQPEPEFRSHRPEVLNDSSRGSMLPTLIFAAVILGLMTWGILSAVNWWQNQQKTNVAETAKPANNSALPANSTSGSNTAGNTNSNAAVPSAPVTGEMKIQIKTSEPVAIRTTSDGKLEDVTVTPDMVRTLTPQQSVSVSYYKGLASAVQMTINGKTITLPTKPKLKTNSIQFDVNKENIAQILQSGMIGFDAPATNVNVAKP